MNDRCEIDRCRAEAEILYLDHAVCGRHWEEFMSENKPLDALRTALGIRAERSSATEDTMARKKQTETTTATASEAAPKPKTRRAPKAAQPVEQTAAREPASTTAETAAEKLTPKEAKRTRAKKSAAPAEAPAKPKKQRPPKEDLVVFAFRLTPAERDAIHKTAGPRNATQFVRRVAVAFAGEDEAAFRMALKEARSLRD